MDIADLVRALLRYDARTARQWVADAISSGLEWSELPTPTGLDSRELAVAAAVVELLAERACVPAPAWTPSVPPAEEPVWLVRVEHRPRLRQRLPDESPPPLRRRRVFAPEDFLRAA